MNYLINEFGLPLAIIFLLLALIIICYVLFLVIKFGVSAGTSSQRELLERQNEYLKKLFSKND